MDQLASNMQTFTVDQLPKLIIPALILVIGWLCAILIGATVRAALRRTGVDDKLAQLLLGAERASRVDAAKWIGKAAYYVALLIVLVGFLQSLQLSTAAEPINELLGSVFAFMPRLVGALGVLLVAWIAASLARKVLTAALARWGLEDRVARELGTERTEGAPPQVVEAEPPAAGNAVTVETQPRFVERAVAEVAYWLILLLFIPAVLSTLELGGMLLPVRNMLDKVLGFLPNFASAAVILAAGWLLATVLRRIVTNVFAGAGIDRLSQRVGLDKPMRGRPLSNVFGVLVYVLVLIPVAVGALNALELEAITTPASSMLQKFLLALPAILGGALVVFLAYVAGRLLSGVVRALLEGGGFDNILTRIGLTKPVNPSASPSRVVGGLVMLAVLFFGAIEGSRLLGFETLAAIITDIATLGGQILLGLAVFGFGLFFGQLADGAIRSSGIAQAKTLASAARGAILVLAGAMGLQQMGIGEEIIELTFAFGLGGVAIAGALAFGLGGRDAAAKTIENLKKSMRESEGAEAAKSSDRRQQRVAH